MSELPVTVTITLRTEPGGDYYARIVGWGLVGGAYGSLWSRALPRVAARESSPASVLAGLSHALLAGITGAGSDQADGRESVPE